MGSCEVEDCVQGGDWEYGISMLAFFFVMFLVGVLFLFLSFLSSFHLCCTSKRVGVLL